MKKEAKSPPDAVQQKLRDHKKKWNPIVSDFINDVIHFKKLMNGAPNKFYQQKGDIKHAIPADPATIIGVLANDFNEIAQEAKSIIEEQIAYSNNRRKRQSKNMEQASLPFGETTAPPNLEQQLTASFSENKLIKLASSFEDKYFLESTGSNPVSRFFARLFTPTFGFSDAAKIRRARMAMLGSAISSWRNLESFQVLITKKSKESLQEAYKKLMQAYHDYKSIETALKEAKTFLPKDIKDDGGKITNKSREVAQDDSKPPVNQPPEDKPQENKPQNNKNTGIIDEANLAAQDIIDTMSFFSKERRLQTSLIDLIEKFKFIKDEESAQDLVNKYLQTIIGMNKKYKTNKNRLSDIAKEVESQKLEAKGQATLKKWFGKFVHQINSDDTSFLRLSAYEKADKMMDNLDKVMDSLEKSFDVETLDELIKIINDEMNGLLTALRHLYLAK